MLVGDMERLRNTLLAARQSVLLAGADAGELHPLWLAGYEAALVTVAVAFGLECREIAPIALRDNTIVPIALSHNAIGVNSHPRLTVRMLDEDGQPELERDLALTTISLPAAKSSCT